jgi:FAD/FMN-containing dehydrogenase
LLPRGLGRSYGDVCLNTGGALLLTDGLDRFLAFDEESGRLTCEAGVSIDEILKLMLPRGWFVPVSPGTRFVSVGGAIANDVHGKNHHRAGTFGRHVTRIWVRRTSGELHELQPGQALFAATVGGLGLTGVIVCAEFQLRRIPTRAIEREVVRFGGIDEFLDLSAAAHSTHEYTVAWFDCLDRRGNRGIFFRGNHADATSGASDARELFNEPAFRVPFSPPEFLLNHATVRVFNTVYFRSMSVQRATRVSLIPFFYPLDSVQAWNRLYGRRGFLQWQCVVPHEPEPAVLRDILRRIARARNGSFLSVLKVFGDLRSPGLLSFPRPGITLALDFPMRGKSTLALLEQLDDVVMDAGGAIYPAKDARMSPSTFRKSFPRLGEFRAFTDPGLSSSFWRRVESV